MRHFVAPMSWCWASVRLATELIQAAMSEVSRTNRPARRYRSLKSEDLSALGLGRHMAALAAGRGRLEQTVFAVDAVSMVCSLLVVTDKNTPYRPYYRKP